VYRAISDDMKERALWLLDAGYLTENVRDILDVSRASFDRWKENQDICGTAGPSSNPL
ncbi:hypothetical protein DFH09DRAFT_843565, partial [Mycena vulgaris]